MNYSTPSIALVVDTSGSMDKQLDKDLDKKIKIVKNCCQRIYRNMHSSEREHKKGSRVGIVEFKDTGKVAMEMKTLSKETYIAALAATNALKAKGWTNMLEGLQMGDHMLKEGVNKNQIMIVFSDGDSNKGGSPEGFKTSAKLYALGMINQGETIKHLDTLAKNNNGKYYQRSKASKLFEDLKKIFHNNGIVNVLLCEDHLLSNTRAQSSIMLDSSDSAHDFNVQWFNDKLLYSKTTASKKHVHIELFNPEGKKHTPDEVHIDQENNSVTLRVNTLAEGNWVIRATTESAAQTHLYFSITTHDHSIASQFVAD